MDIIRRYLYLLVMLLAISTFTFTFSAHTQGNSIRVPSVKFIAVKREPIDEKLTLPGATVVINSVVGVDVPFLTD